ncbi:MAG: hypothetical protein NZ937_03175 [Armatimonadetes bacterium]|nr:hypothetical protein [Armatimonadota bacterium]
MPGPPRRRLLLLRRVARGRATRMPSREPASPPSPTIELVSSPR